MCVAKCRALGGEAQGCEVRVTEKEKEERERDVMGRGSEGITNENAEVRCQMSEVRNQKSEGGIIAGENLAMLEHVEEGNGVRSVSSYGTR